MKFKNTVDMSKWKNLILTNTVAVIAIVFFNWFFHIEYRNEGSYDIIVGAFIEVLILGAYFEFINQRGQKNLEKHLATHLEQIEKMVKKKL